MGEKQALQYFIAFGAIGAGEQSLSAILNKQENKKMQWCLTI